MAIYIWDINLDTSKIHAERILEAGHMSPDEHRRAAKILNDTQRAEYVCGTASIRCILDKEFDAQLGNLPFQRSKDGKPTNQICSGFFNYTRTPKRIFLAVNPSGNVGIDAELVSNRTIDMEILRRIEPISAFLHSKSEWNIHRNNLKLAAWTVLEALIKHEGQTIQWFFSDNRREWLLHMLNTSAGHQIKSFSVSNRYVVSCVSTKTVANTSPKLIIRSVNIEDIFKLC
jgi:phosphopantetheinyl transferase